MLGARAIPVVDHLRSQDQVERKASDESVKNQFVLDFLKSGEDAGERAEKVVEDLNKKNGRRLAQTITISGMDAHRSIGGEGE